MHVLTEATKCCLTDVYPNIRLIYASILASLTWVTYFEMSSDGPKCHLFAGKDATDDFEDVGHSKGARAMLDDLYVGDIDPSTIPTKVQNTPPAQPQNNQDKTSSSSSSSSDFMTKMLQFLLPLFILGVAVGIRFYNTKST